jgi:hypothetical protein
MANKWTKKNGVKVLNVPGKVNPIAREPIDNSSDLERKEFEARSKRKFPAPAASTPGIKRTTNPEATSSLPS